MRKFLPFLLVLAMASCTPPSKSNVDEIKYFKDDRTGVCFASNRSGNTYGGYNLTAVPCELVIGKVTVESFRESK